MAHKRTVTMEEKVNLARACSEGKMSQSEASQKAGAGRSAIQKWSSRYEAEGAAAFLPHERNRVYSLELKRNAVRDYLNRNGSLQTICRKYKIRSDSQLRMFKSLLPLSNPKQYFPFSRKNQNAMPVAITSAAGRASHMPSTPRKCGSKSSSPSRKSRVWQNERSAEVLPLFSAVKSDEA